MKTSSIRDHIKRTIVYATAITMLIFLLIVGADRLNDMHTMMEKKIVYITNLLQTSLPIPVWNIDEKSTNDILDAVFLEPDLVYIAIIEEGALVSSREKKKYTDKTFSYFKQRASFKTSSVAIVQDGENIATVQIVISSKRLRTKIYKDIAYIFILTLFLVIVVTMRIFSTMHSSIFTPLKKLEDSATLISSGNLDESISKQGNDEIGRLGDTFETMRQSIKTLIHQLNDANEDLEEKVKQRTIALEDAHISIQSSIQYASLIQGALIPEKELFQLTLSG